MKKQTGFMVTSLLVVIGVLSLLLFQWAEYQEKKNIRDNAESFYNKVLDIRKHLHAYSVDNINNGVPINSNSIFPTHLTGLVPFYYPVCALSDNRAGRCQRIDQTPWGDIKRSDYRRVGVGGTPSNPDFYRVELKLPVPPANDEAFKYERSATLSLFSRLPGVTFDESKNELLMRIDRPGGAFGYEALLKRDGSSTLWGDWDLGGLFGITNAKDYSLKAGDGSQIVVSDRLSTVETVSHGVWVDKPTCPTGKKPKPQFGIAGIHHDTGRYELNGGIKGYVMNETTTKWQVGVSIQAKDKNTGASAVITDGQVLVIGQCVY